MADKLWNQLHEISLGIDEELVNLSVDRYEEAAADNHFGLIS